jgi:branched-chain amino acid transport system substrate-binding protein
MRRWVVFMDSYYPGGDRKSIFTTYGYSAAELLVQVLKQCGDELSRESVMRQATNLKQVKLCCCRGCPSTPAGLIIVWSRNFG